MLLCWTLYTLQQETRWRKDKVFLKANTFFFLLIKKVFVHESLKENIHSCSLFKAALHSSANIHMLALFKNRCIEKWHGIKTDKHNMQSVKDSI